MNTPTFLCQLKAAVNNQRGLCRKGKEINIS